MGAVDFFEIVTSFGKGPVIAGLVAFLFCYVQREKAFYILMVFTAISVFNQDFKMFYHQPRPYMVSHEIQAFSCDKSFGNPSGHASLCSCFYLSLFLMAFHDKDYKIPRRTERLLGGAHPREYDEDYKNPLTSNPRKTIRNPIIWILSFVSLVAFVLMVGISRVMLGMHAIN